MKKLLSFFAFLFLAGLITAQSAQEYKIIVHNENTKTQLTSKEIENIFLKKLTHWDDGTKIMPVDQVSDAPVRERFTNGIFNKSISAIKAYWQKQIFTGKATPPVEKSSDQDVLEYVKSNPGAIGYISASSGASGAKVLTIIK
ncbi:MAG: substrate-binding domain-containing protein [Calditrichaceae bacterium]|nr:substrate-binding domain-containing protein [Calditrichaceae bacterium]MBN2710401.1 substrate-binding domain-containing protein [Calditrichaceae bacterium]RQV92877.1 MAG: phosphate ABC transporter substrate-binding protein [Calditrichota bacterium]